jgi:hypothetical protein
LRTRVPDQNLFRIRALPHVCDLGLFRVRSEAPGNMPRKRLALAKLGMAGLFTGWA